CGDPRKAFAQIADKLWLSLDESTQAPDETAPPEIDASARVDPTAIVRAGARIGADVRIGPHSVIGRGVVLGAGVTLAESVSISHAVIGARTQFLPGVRVGQAGFGVASGSGGLVRVPQLGRVIIEEDVEIGANTTIDRGALGDTVIGAGTKIDNLVQIGHNVRIGRNCIIVGQCGLSGSCTLGDDVVLGGQVGVKDHATIGAGAMIVARAGVMRDVPPGERWGGAPAQPITEFMREVATLSALAKKKKA
ncbi:MAG: UDP-3-O-(3-hydroxymyristoyl)glucosamine N-acyltransferase, partial [Pseudomonadota bacterium]